MHPRWLHPRQRGAPEHPHRPKHHFPLREQPGHGGPVRPGGRAATSTPVCRTPPTTGWPPRSAPWRGARRPCSPPPARRPTSTPSSTSASCRGPCGVLRRHLRGHLQPLRRDHEADGHRVHLRGPRLHRGGARRRLPPQHQGSLWGDHRQPRPHRPGLSKSSPRPPTPTGCPSSWTTPSPPRSTAAPSSGGPTLSPTPPPSTWTATPTA